MDSTVVQIAGYVAVPVLAAGWAIIRYELGRYAKAHPNAPVVKDAQTVIAEAKAVAPVLGITAPKVAGFIAGALAAHGHVVPAQSIVATAEAVQAAATADLAAVAQAGPIAPVPPAPQAQEPTATAVPSTGPTTPAQ